MKTFRSFIVFSVGTVLLLLLRTWQLLFMFETATGFYKPQYSPVGAIICEATFVLVLALIVCFPLLQKVQFVCHFEKRPFMIVASLLTSFTYIYNASCLAFTFGILSIDFILTLLAGLFFFLYGLFGFLKITMPLVFSLAPLPLWLYKLFVVFLAQSGVSRFTENAYEIITLCVILLFLLNCAKFLSNVEKQHSLRFLTATGFLTATLCFIYTIPRYLVSVLGASQFLHHSLQPDVTVLGTGIFALALTFFCLRYGTNKPATDDCNTTLTAD